MKYKEFQDLSETLEYWFREERENECLYTYSNDDLAQLMQLSLRNKKALRILVVNCM